MEKKWAGPFFPRERGGSVVECRTPEREVRGSRPTAVVLCPWARHFTPRKYWLITQEAMAPSRHDWKIVDWDVKPQHNQPTILSPPRLVKVHISTLPCHEYANNLCFVGGGEKLGRPIFPHPNKIKHQPCADGYLGGEKLGWPLFSHPDKWKHQPYPVMNMQTTFAF